MSWRARKWKDRYTRARPQVASTWVSVLLGLVLLVALVLLLLTYV